MDNRQELFHGLSTEIKAVQDKNDKRAIELFMDDFCKTVFTACSETNCKIIDGIQKKTGLSRNKTGIKMAQEHLDMTKGQYDKTQVRAIQAEINKPMDTRIDGRRVRNKFAEKARGMSHAQHQRDRAQREGKINTRMLLPTETHAKIKRYARKVNMTVTAYTELLINIGLKQQEEIFKELES